MTSPRSIVLRTAGTNCEAETADALRLAGSPTEVLHLNQLIREPQRLEEVEILVIAGGFSYGDDLSAGRVWAAELRHALGAALSAHAAKGGLLLGVCNGFQVLVETGMLRTPAETKTQASAAGEFSLPPAEEREIALYGNASNTYECRWVTLQSQASACPWLVEGELWPCPVAHAEGRFVVRDQGVLERLRAAGQIALRYTNADGSPTGYPGCPNGSVEEIAGICDPSGRILGLMPHPERNLYPWSHPQWTRRDARDEGEGLLFYRRMVRVAADGIQSPGGVAAQSSAS